MNLMAIAVYRTGGRPGVLQTRISSLEVVQQDFPAANRFQKRCQQIGSFKRRLLLQTRRRIIVAITDPLYNPPTNSCMLNWRLTRRLEIVLIASPPGLIDTNIVLARKELRAGGIGFFHEAGWYLALSKTGAATG